MTENKKFIDCYNEWIKRGRMPDDGMCRSLPKYLINSEEFNFCVPTVMEAFDNLIEGGGYSYWGIMNLANELKNEFTPLRQTIILLCSCMRDEY